MLNAGGYVMGRELPGWCQRANAQARVDGLSLPYVPSGSVPWGGGKG